MNQILVTEKLYITPEMKRKKLMYKLEFFLSVFLVCLLSSWYIYAEYDRNKSEQVSQQILASLKYSKGTTVEKPVDNAPIVVILDIGKEQEQQETQETQENQQEEEQKNQQDTKTYVSEDGVEYTTEAILKIPKIKIEYPVLSATSPELLYVSLNRYWPTPDKLKPNGIGNYCIVGHYYESGKMFGKLHKLQNGDIAELTDMAGNTVKYEVYHKMVVQPDDTSCTSQQYQLENNLRELTLITCTNHGKQRLVVKLREI